MGVKVRDGEKIIRVKLKVSFSCLQTSSLENIRIKISVYFGQEKLQIFIEIRGGNLTITR